MAPPMRSRISRTRAGVPPTRVSPKRCSSFALGHDAMNGLALFRLPDLAHATDSQPVDQAIGTDALERHFGCDEQDKSVYQWALPSYGASNSLANQMADADRGRSRRKD